MTRKDHIRIARALAKVRGQSTTEDIRKGVDLVTEELVTELLADNPIFDPEKFIAAVRDC